MEIFYRNLIGLYKDFGPINIKRRNFIEVFLVTNELMQMTFRAYQFEQAIAARPEAFDKAKAAFRKHFKKYS